MFEQFIAYLSTPGYQHPHKEIGLKVFDLLAYVAGHLEEVVAAGASNSLFRHPQSHMAIHLHDDTPQAVKAHVVQLLAEVAGALTSLFALPEPGQGHALDYFLLNIQDSPTGCMEVRLRQALEFVGQWHSTGLVTADNLMQRYYEEYQGNLTAENLLDFFGPKMALCLPLLVDGEVVPLSWVFIHQYLQEVLYEEVETLWHAFGTQPLVTVERITKKQQAWQDYYFPDALSAQRYLSYVKSLLPQEAHPALYKAQVKATLGQSYFSLTARQQHVLLGPRHSILPHTRGIWS